MGSMTKAKFTIIDPAKPSTGKLTTFKDVAGMEEAKTEVRAFPLFMLLQLILSSFAQSFSRSFNRSVVRSVNT